MAPVLNLIHTTLLATNILLPCVSGQSSVVTDPYAPITKACTPQVRVRPATGLNSGEASYVTQRKPLADRALRAWLQRAWGSSSNVSNSDLPTLSLAFSGGGPKAGLLSAGIFQAMDSRDSSSDVNGLLQAMTYAAGLSGGSLTLGGIMGNNYAKVSTMRKKLWNTSYQDLFGYAAPHDPQIAADVTAKEVAGYPATVLDVYARGLGYDVINGTTGANGLTWSSFVHDSAFTDHRAPFPIITQTNARVNDGECIPPLTDPIWESTPYEFGSWNNGVQGFLPMRYLGTTMKGGQPANPSACTLNFDNLGFIIGMSSDILVRLADPVCELNSTAAAELGNLTTLVPDLAQKPVYGIIPNPFFRNTASKTVNGMKQLYMLDGGLSGQDIPLVPLLQPERDVDVIFAADINSDSPMDITSGGGIYNTSLYAKEQGLSRMPTIPDPATFAAQNLTSRAQFFGCGDKSVITIVYLPDANTTEYSSKTTSYPPSDIDNLVQLGADMATQTGNSQWPACVACAVMEKAMPTLPSVCTSCFKKYCWTE